MQPAKICGTGENVILSVEDDHAAYVLLQLGFNEVGGDFRLYRVEDGAQALDFLRRSGDYATAPKPNLILLNLNLPRVTGFDVLEAMQADPELGEVPAVVCIFIIPDGQRQGEMPCSWRSELCDETHRPG